MVIPHIDTIRELRETIEACEGVGELLQEVQYALNALGLMRRHPSDELPGEDLMTRLSERPGLEGIRAADAPPTAPWPRRIQARELALRSAQAMLGPLATEAHQAAHTLTDLRRAQLEAIEAAGETALLDEVHALFAELHGAEHEMGPTFRRRGMIGPATAALATVEEKLARAIESTAPIRDALCEAFTQSATEVMDSLLTDLQVGERFPDGTPEEVHAALLEWQGRFVELDEELGRELDALQARREAAEARVRELLG